jgi:hypothetical protein
MIVLEATRKTVKTNSPRIIKQLLPSAYKLMQAPFVPIPVPVDSATESPLWGLSQGSCVKGFIFVTSATFDGSSIESA